MSDNSDAAASPLLSGVLLALAERCEHEKPSDVLDAHIAVALRIGPGNVEDNHWLYRNFPNWLVRADGRVEAQPNGVHWAPVPFSASLDAAVTLELPGFYVTVVSGQGQPCAACWLDAESGVQFNGEAKSEPMARCAAALRARAAIAKATGGDQ